LRFELRGDWRLKWAGWETYNNSGAFAEFGVDLELSTKLINDSLGDIDTQSADINFIIGDLVTTAEILSEGGGGHTSSRVLDGDSEEAVFGLSFEFGSG